jgi:hypothetical protein
MTLTIEIRGGIVYLLDHELELEVRDYDLDGLDQEEMKRTGELTIDTQGRKCWRYFA